MTRNEAIRAIETLYPADSEYAATAEIGKQLLAQARDDMASDWRNESDEVLFLYAKLCEATSNG